MQPQPSQKKFEFLDRDLVSNQIKPLSIGLGLGFIKSKSAIQAKPLATVAQSSQNPKTPQIPRVAFNYVNATVSTSRPSISYQNSAVEKFFKHNFLQLLVVFLLLLATSLSVLLMVTLTLKVTPVESIALVKKALSLFVLSYRSYDQSFHIYSIPDK